MQQRGYTNIDALDGSEEMLKVAEKKNVYKNLYTRFLGPEPIKGIEKSKFVILIISLENHTHVVLQFAFVEAYNHGLPRDQDEHEPWLYATTPGQEPLA